MTKANGCAITEKIVKKAVKELTPRRLAEAKPKRPSWAAVSKEAKSFLAQASSSEKSLKAGKDPEAALRFMSAIQPFLESLAKRRVLET